jgi:hypothetical protein
LLQEQRPDLDVMRGEAGVGKIILKTTSSPQEVKSLRTVQSFLAFITRRNDIAMQNPNEPDVIAVCYCGMHKLYNEWESSYFCSVGIYYKFGLE